ncbi:MAG TPA: hypothetical protein VJQ59_16995 [Candidatus Sulfotelmatobacter sp.]|nr:hypothetical protein [Candidatus Sulfotelmatobacter sp.]
MAECFYVNHGSLVPAEDADYDGDPRGIVWMYEQPKPNGEYVIGVDPSVGIVGWNRFSRRDDDVKTDNAVVEVIKCGRGSEIPDVQVAEYAAPIDPDELAEVANIIGRVFGGRNEDGQAKCIIEVYPNPGLLTHRRMVELGYLNMFNWTYLNGVVPVPKVGQLGWYSTPKTQQALWLRGSKHMTKKNFIPRSPWLVEEMADVVLDMQKMRARAYYGHHDDRLQATLMALWCARQFSMEAESIPTDLRTDQRPPDPQRMPVTYAQMMEDFEDSGFFDGSGELEWPGHLQ